MWIRFLSLAAAVVCVWVLAIGVPILGGRTVAAQEWPLGPPLPTPTPGVPCVPVTNDGGAENGYGGDQEFCQIHMTDVCPTATGLHQVTELLPRMTRVAGPNSHTFYLNVRGAPHGPDGPPGELLRTHPVIIDSIPIFPATTNAWFQLPVPGPASLPNTNYICISWTPPAGDGPFIAVDQSPGTPFLAGYTRANGQGPWEIFGVPSNPNHRALLLDGEGVEAGIFGSGMDRTGNLNGEGWTPFP